MVVSAFVSCLALADPDGIYDALPGPVHHSVRNFPGPWAAVIGQTPGGSLAHKAPHSGMHRHTGRIWRSRAPRPSFDDR